MDAIQTVGKEDKSKQYVKLKQCSLFLKGHINQISTYESIEGLNKAKMGASPWNLLGASNQINICDDTQKEPKREIGSIHDCRPFLLEENISACIISQNT